MLVDGMGTVMNRHAHVEVLGAVEAIEAICDECGAPMVRAVAAIGCHDCLMIGYVIRCRNGHTEE